MLILTSGADFKNTKNNTVTVHVTALYGSCSFNEYSAITNGPEVFGQDVNGASRRGCFIRSFGQRRKYLAEPAKVDRSNVVCSFSDENTILRGNHAHFVAFNVRADENYLSSPLVYVARPVGETSKTFCQWPRSLHADGKRDAAVFLFRT